MTNISLDVLEGLPDGIILFNYFLGGKIQTRLLQPYGSVLTEVSRMLLNGRHQGTTEAEWVQGLHEAQLLTIMTSVPGKRF